MPLHDVSLLEIETAVAFTSRKKAAAAEAYLKSGSELLFRFTAMP